MTNDSPRARQIRELIARRRREIAAKRATIAKAQASVKASISAIAKHKMDLAALERLRPGYPQVAIPITALSTRALRALGEYDGHTQGEDAIRIIFADDGVRRSNELLRIAGCGVGTYLEIIAFAFSNGLIDGKGLDAHHVLTWGRPRWQRALTALQEHAVAPTC